jgi:sn-glycerol 3-phosphate transport system substrate-binding protein
MLLLGTLLSGNVLAKTKITMWTFSGGEEAYKKIHEALMPEFQKEFPDVELEISYIPDTNVKYLVAYVAGAAPDIVSMRTANQAEFIEQGMVVPIVPSAFGAKSETDLEKMLLPGTVQTLNYRNGKMYFMATEISVFGLFASNDLLAQAGLSGIPATWEEMLAVGKKLVKTDADGKYTQIGMTIPRGWIWPTFTFPTLMGGYGVDPLSADGKSQFSNPNAIKALSIYPELWRKLSDPVGSTANHWKEGKSAFYWGANYMISQFTKANYVFNWSSAPMPKFAAGQKSTVSYALGHFVSAQSKQQDLLGR